MSAGDDGIRGNARDDARGSTRDDARTHTHGVDDEPRPGVRLCARVSCSNLADHTLTADYSERIMAVGPLSPEHIPPALDLCARHADALTPPTGWQMLRHDPGRN